jgi:hypothetical protein
MINTALIKLHDTMQGAYDRSLIVASLSPKNYFPIAIGEFAKELATNPLLEDIRQKIADVGKIDFDQYIQSKAAVSQELNDTLLLLKSNKAAVAVIGSYIAECDQLKAQCPPKSAEEVTGLRQILMRAISDLMRDRNHDHREILAHLVVVDEKGKITGYIFVPSWSKFNQAMKILQRNSKACVWNSCNYLIQQFALFYDVEGRNSKINGFLLNNHPSAVQYLKTEANNFDLALERVKREEAILLGFDTEECKVHLHRVWEFIKPLLLITQSKNAVREDGYDEKTGILVRDNRSIIFQKGGLPDKILSLLHPNGAPSSNSIPFEDIYYEAIKIETDPEWFELNTDEIMVVNRKIYSACHTINDRATNAEEQLKKQKFISPNNTSVIIVSK